MKHQIKKKWLNESFSLWTNNQLISVACRAWLLASYWTLPWVPVRQILYVFCMWTWWLYPGHAVPWSQPGVEQSKYLQTLHQTHSYWLSNLTYGKWDQSSAWMRVFELFNYKYPPRAAYSLKKGQSGFFSMNNPFSEMCPSRNYLSDLATWSRSQL